MLFYFNLVSLFAPKISKILYLFFILLAIVEASDGKYFFKILNFVAWWADLILPRNTEKIYLYFRKEKHSVVESSHHSRALKKLCKTNFVETVQN